ncbi:MAG: DUF192 domain-containing protein [bacterium]|nr:DUF192 domain-containing protein [bacterium]
MKSSHIKIFIVFFVLTIGAYFIFNREEDIVVDEGSGLQLIIIGDKELFVEIATSPEERALGLMHRTELKENHGMLFIFQEEPTTLQFWNKNTLIPLDIIWALDNKVIGTSSLPAISDEITFVQSPSVANKVIEVNTGWTKTNDIKINDGITY